MPPAPSMSRSRRKTANRVRTRSGRTPPASRPRPVLSRHRIHRLTRSLSCRCGMREKSRTFRPAKPRRCICQASRGYSASQPPPSARSVTCRRDQASSATALLRFLPNASRHSCSVRSRSEDAPLPARKRTMIITMNGGALPSRSSCRRCSAYCTSSFRRAGRASSLIRSQRRTGCRPRLRRTERSTRRTPGRRVGPPPPTAAGAPGRARDRRRCARMRGPGTASRRTPDPAGRRRARRHGTPDGPRPPASPEGRASWKAGRGGNGGHHDTCFPDSQPAFSSAARASSAVRCP